MFIAFYTNLCERKSERKIEERESEGKVKQILLRLIGRKGRCPWDMASANSQGSTEGFPWLLFISNISPKSWVKACTGDRVSFLRLGRGKAGLSYRDLSIYHLFFALRTSPFCLIKSSLSFSTQRNSQNTIFQFEKKPKASGKFSTQLGQETTIEKGMDQNAFLFWLPEIPIPEALFMQGLGLCSPKLSG